jgi:membrane dipeptidase
MEKNRELISPVTDYAGIDANMKAGKMSALLTLEEGGVCQGDIRLLRDFYRLGVRMMTLTWNFPNELGYPVKVTEGELKGKLYNESQYGLTATGISFVKEMERLGIIIDVSHLNDAGIEDVLKYTTKPFVASHSNARTICSHPRNLPDDLIRKMADRGCVIGINYGSTFLHDWLPGEKEVGRISDMVDHIRYIKNIGGIDCLGLGSDFDGIDEPLEIGSPIDVPLLFQALQKKGFTQSEIEAIFYKNVLRLYKEIL